MCSLSCCSPASGMGSAELPGSQAAVHKQRQKLGSDGVQWLDSPGCLMLSQGAMTQDHTWDYLLAARHPPRTSFSRNCFKQNKSMMVLGPSMAIPAPTHILVDQDRCWHCSTVWKAATCDASIPGVISEKTPCQACDGRRSICHDNFVTVMLQLASGNHRCTASSRDSPERRLYRGRADSAGGAAGSGVGCQLLFAHPLLAEF